MKYILMGLGILIIFFFSLFAGAFVYKTPEEKQLEDLEQMKFLKEWSEKHNKK